MIRTLTAATIFAGTMVLPGAAQEKLTHTKDSLETVKANLRNGTAVLVDVREQKEWDEGHLKAARLLPMSKLKAASQLDDLLQSLPKDKIIYAHCRAGVRALTCGEILKKHGFDVRPLKAGYQELVEAGFEKADNKK